MFEQSLVESTHVIKAQNRWTVWASIAIQAAIAAVIVIVPLMHPETIGRLSFNAPQLVLPAPPPPPPPPPVRVMVRSESLATDQPAAAAPQAPQLRPALLNTSVALFGRPQPDGDGPPGPPTNLPTGMGNSTATGTDALSTAPTGPRVSVARVGPVRLSTGVTAGLLLAPIRPVYPPIARAAHMEGTVTVHAIISKSGNIESATVIGGPVMLQSSALESVREARYHPYLLNGTPTEVDTTIIINFRLSE